MHQKKGMLALSVLVNGSWSKAEIGIRKGGRKGRLSAVGATYNLFTNKAEFLPGHYDISVRPLKAYLSLGVPDIFHGRSSGTGIKTRRVKGVEPIILRDIEIKSGETLDETVKFKTK